MYESENDAADFPRRQQIVERARALGADLIGFAPVERWEQYKETAPEFFPHSVFPGTKTVIVLAKQIFLPMLETTPSAIYRDLYETVNRQLDELAYTLAKYLYDQEQRALFFPRDVFKKFEVPGAPGEERVASAFSHVIAGKYAGLGTIGYNHTLLCPEFGPRMRLVSVFTDAVLPPSPMHVTELCTKCELCRKACPAQAFRTREGLIADMDIPKCTARHSLLKTQDLYPCGVCIKVCPIGKDKRRYAIDTRSE